MGTFKLFKDYQDYKSHEVDSPSYQPLEQEVIWDFIDKKLLKKEKRRLYAREYYEKNREHINALNRKNYRKRAELSKKNEVVVSKNLKNNEMVIKLKGKIADLEQEVKRLNKEIAERGGDVKSYSNAVISNLENRNAEMQVEIDELKSIIKFLFKYFK